MCKPTDKKSSGTYDFSKFNDNSKVDKKEAGDKKDDCCCSSKQQLLDFLKTFEEMESQLNTVKKQGLTLKKKVNMWRMKYMEIEE